MHEVTPARPSLRATVRLLILAFVALLALDHYRNHLAHSPGIDFFQYWAVPMARRLSVEPLGSPYAETQRYAETIRNFSSHTGDPRLEAVVDYWKTPDFASDPLVYVIGGWLPADYTTALRTYQFLQFAALAVALFLLARMSSLPGLETAILGLLMFVYYMPILSELRVLNTNAVVLVALAGATWLLQTRSGTPPPWGRLAAALCLAVFAAFLKPIWAPLPGLILLHLLYQGRRLEVLKSAAVAGGLALVLFIWPAVVFGPSIWPEWYRSVFGDSSDRLFYSVEQGNRSTAVVLVEATGMSANAATGVIAAFLSASLLVSWLIHHKAASPRGWRVAGRSLGNGLLGRPETALALGIAGALALSPLAWWHYYTVALLPVFVLLAPGAPRALGALAALSFLLSSGRLGPIYVAIGDPDNITVLGAALAWIPLWLGLLTITLWKRPQRDSQ